MNERYLKYKSIKNKLSSYSYNNINISEVSASFIAEFYINKQISIFKKIYLYLLLLFTTIKLNTKVNNFKNIFLFIPFRPSWRTLCFAYIKKINFKIQPFEFPGYKLFISYKAFLFSLKIILKIKDINFIDRFIIFACINGSTNQIESLLLQHNDKTSKIQKIYFFNAASRWESVFVGFYNMKKIETFSIAHAFYYKFKKPYPIDIINYENLYSKYLLQWSSFSINQISDFLPKKCKQVNFGYPLIKRSNQFDMNSKNILVALPRLFYKKSNKKLLQILNQLNDKNKFNFYIVLHPTDNNKNYIEYNKINNFIFANSNFEDTLKSKKFICTITYNSTCIFESILSNLIPLIFKNDNLEFYFKELKYFSNHVEFLKLMSSLSYNSNPTSRIKKVFFD